MIPNKLSQLTSFFATALCLLIGTSSISAKVYVVNSLSSANNGLQPGEMTLPYAIWESSGAFIERDRPQCLGPDTILFDIDPQFANGQTTGPYELQITQGIQIYDELHIDGFSQPGSSLGNPMIYISGNDNDVFQFSGHREFGDASGSSLRGTGIINAKSFAIYISSVTDITIENNYIGVNSDGSSNAGMDKGITIVDGASDLTIQNNVISGARGNALEIKPGTNQITQQFSTSSDIVISGNKIGTDITGTQSTTAYGSGGSGIAMYGVDNVEITNNILGNNSLNPISNFSDKDAVNLGNTSNVTISGNFIGVGADGTTNMANGDNGIAIWSDGGGGGGGNITITNNNISNNEGNGIEVSGSQSSNVTIGGALGDTDQASGNIISHNGENGVYITDFGGGAASTDPVRLNSIYCNGAGGINTTGGGNNSMPDPVIDTDASTETRLVGTGQPGATIDLYQVGPDCYNCGADAFADRQGKIYLGSTTVDGSGDWIFDCGSGLYQGVTATATDGSNNTSPFSNIYNVNCDSPPLEPDVALVAEPEEFCEGSTTTLTATPTNGGVAPTYIFYVNGAEICNSTSPNCTPDASAFSGPKDLVEVVMIQDNDYCYELRSEDFVWVTVIPGLAPPDAGDDATICAGETHQLSGIADGYTDFSWSTNGDGEFSSETSLNAIYTPGEQDINTGTVTLTLNGVGGCNSDGDEMELTIDPMPEPELEDALLCSGGTVTLDPGTGNEYDYSWESGEATETISVDATGTYTVTVSSTNGCSNTATADVTISPEITIDLQTDYEPCNAEPTGTIDMTFSGGIDPISVLWSNGSDQENLADLEAGTYTVTLTDDNGCTETATIEVEQGTAVEADATLIEGVSKYLESDGSVEASASNGTAPYEFLWNDAGATTTTTATGLPEGTYTVTVTDASGCTDTAMVYVPQPEPLGLEISGDILTPCPGDCSNDLEVVASGGIPPYSYEWFDGSDNTTVEDLCAGVWAVTVTDSKGAVVAGDFTIAEPTHITADVTTTEADCDGAANGTITVVADGGTPPYSYTWNSGFGNTPNVTTATAGTHEVSIFDANNCQIQETALVDEATSMTLSATAENVSCFGLSDGSIDLSAVGGPQPYAFIWSNGIDTEDITDIPAGEYRVTATDADGCERQRTVSIEQPEILTGFITDADLLCFDDANGSLDLTTTGGTGPYTYIWSNGANTADLSNLTADNYGVTITDANDCSTTLFAGIEQPTELTITSELTDVMCAGQSTGRIVIQINGGTPDYTYDWSPNDVNNQLDGLPAGNYQLTVTDANGCQTAENFTITEPLEMVVTFSKTDATCFGSSNGSISLNPTNGTPPYAFNWSDNSNEQNLNNVVAANYAVTITDDNECALIQNVTIEQPEIVRIAATADSYLICPDNPAHLHATATGGSGDYRYVWSTDDPSMTDLTAQDPIAYPTGTTSYFVAAFDENDCPSDLDQVEINIATPVQLTVRSLDYEICEGENAILTHQGSGSDTAFHVYHWAHNTSDFAASDELTVSPLSTTTYYATVTDNCNTTASDSLTVVVTPTPHPMVQATHLPECDQIIVQLTNLDTTNAGGTCTWNFGDGTSSEGSCDSLTHTFPEPGNYDVGLVQITSNGCEGITQLPTTFDYAPHPVASFTPDKFEREVPDVTWEFDNQSTGASAYTWDFGDFTIADTTTNATHSYNEDEPGYYTVTLNVENEYGCTNLTTQTIYLKGVYGIYAPNAFTPNNDSYNEFWHPKHHGLNSLEYTIYDRWGDVIYEGQGFNDFWDGTFKDTGEPVKQDVYTWTLSATSEWTPDLITATGRVTVIR